MLSAGGEEDKFRQFQWSVRDRGQGAFCRTSCGDFDKAIQLDRDYALAYVSRSRAFFSLGQDAKRGANFDKACILDSSLLGCD